MQQQTKTKQKQFHCGNQLLYILFKFIHDGRIYQISLNAHKNRENVNNTSFRNYITKS